MLDDHVAGVRLPLLTTTDFKRGSPDSEEVMSTDQALLVLALPNNEDRHWGNYELELVNSVVTQVLFSSTRIDHEQLKIMALS
jgi:hypothetical protein